MSTPTPFEATDHATAARALLDSATKTNDVVIARNRIIAAQTEAALALVDEQRTANLLAYVGVLEAQYAESARHPTEFDQSTKAASLARHAAALDLIREALGL